MSRSGEVRGDEKRGGSNEKARGSAGQFVFGIGGAIMLGFKRCDGWLGVRGSDSYFGARGCEQG